MQEKLGQFKDRMSERWNSTDKSVRIKIIITAIFLIIALGLTIYLTARPKWVVIESNSDIATIGQIENLFNDNSIESNIVKNGTAIEVEEKNVDAAKILLAQSNIAKTGFSFDDAISTTNIGMSESDKSEMYLRATESDIASLIERVEGVDSAKVKLVLPGDSVLFESQKKEASAGVTVVTNQELSKDQTMTIARLVAMSVDGLELKNIEIADQNAQSLYSGSTSEPGSASSKDEIEKQKKKEIEMYIRTALAQLYDDVNIIPNIKIDWNNRQEEQVTYQPPVDGNTDGVKNKEVVEEQEVVNGGNGEEPGLNANDEYDTNYAMEENTNASATVTKKNNEYLYNKQTVVTDYATGEFIPDDSSISIVVYNYREFDEKQLEENGTLNDDMTWSTFKEQNSAQTRLVIDDDLINNLRVGTGINNIAMVGYEKPMFVDKVVKPLAIEQIIILAILAILLILLAIGLIRKAQPDEVEEIEPELEVEKLLAKTQMQEEEEEEERRRLAAIKDVDSEYMNQINKFVDEKPEAVAQLLRNWLADEWE
ncbi:MAG: flagellar M-ring protein FliF [Firmicutes bacterium]|nr:flagellar M-ring protein FliF [Bacillota bacterium]